MNLNIWKKELKAKIAEYYHCPITMVKILTYQQYSSFLNDNYTKIGTIRFDCQLGYEILIHVDALAYKIAQETGLTVIKS